VKIVDELAFFGQQLSVLFEIRHVRFEQLLLLLYYGIDLFLQLEHFIARNDCGNLLERSAIPPIDCFLHVLPVIFDPRLLYSKL
jgi:hypothetical protein